MSSQGVAAFNELDEDVARDRLLTCLDVPRWADEVLAARPYDTLGELEDKLTEAAATMSDEELERALARHPRIGERPDATKHDASHSSREQSGVEHQVIVYETDEHQLAFHRPEWLAEVVAWFAKHGAYGQRAR